MAEVVLAGVTKRFGAVVALDGVDLSVPDGGFVVLLGPTGAGKTTLLRLVAGLETADAGRIAIAGRDVSREPPAHRDVAMVFQQYSLYPHLTVRENLAFPLRSPLRPHSPAEIERITADVAAMLRIPHKLDAKATELSGGEMQRVSIGRALVRRPAIYLMDEPLSSLDAKLRADLRVELKHIQAGLGATMLYVTHDQTEAMTMATHVGVLDAGRLVQFGSPRSIYEDPDSVYVATRLGQPRINVAPLAVFPGLPAPPRATQLGLRPEMIALSPVAGPELPHAAQARIRRVERLGDQTRLHLALAGTDLVTLTDPHTPLQPDEEVRVAARAPLFFDAAGMRIRGAAA